MGDRIFPSMDALKARVGEQMFRSVAVLHVRPGAEDLWLKFRDGTSVQPPIFPPMGNFTVGDHQGAGKPAAIQIYDEQWNLKAMRDITTYDELRDFMRDNGMMYVSSD